MDKGLKNERERLCKPSTFSHCYSNNKLDSSTCGFVIWIISEIVLVVDLVDFGDFRLELDVEGSVGWQWA